MKVGIFGGTGNVGKVFVDLALERGHSLVLLARDPNKVTLVNPQLEIIKGDAKNADDVKRVVDGVDVVVR